jgi:anhydro-N-acetylmuramic acid kinase
VTIQWLDPALLAKQTDCPVISDFRRADCAAGGQGAPLVPFADWALFADPHQGRTVLNLGGIANVTHLPPAARLDQVFAFDTGPANCLSDWLCRTLDPDGPGYDAEGARALRGGMIESVARQFLADRYFSRTPPKSTDGPEMIDAFQKAMRIGNPKTVSSNLNDLLATAAFLTARTITQAAAVWDVSRWIVSGGGMRNQAIMGQLRQHLGPAVTIQSTDDFGIPSEAKEAMAFALLGAATLAGIPSNVPSVTGAAHPAILGSITPRPLASNI